MGHRTPGPLRGSVEGDARDASPRPAAGSGNRSPCRVGPRTPLQPATGDRKPAGPLEDLDVTRSPAGPRGGPRGSPSGGAVFRHRDGMSRVSRTRWSRPSAPAPGSRSAVPVAESDLEETVRYGTAKRTPPCWGWSTARGTKRVGRRRPCVFPGGGGNGRPPCNRSRRPAAEGEDAAGMAIPRTDRVLFTGAPLFRTIILAAGTETAAAQRSASVTRTSPRLRPHRLGRGKLRGLRTGWTAASRAAPCRQRATPRRTGGAVLQRGNR